MSKSRAAARLSLNQAVLLTFVAAVSCSGLLLYALLASAKHTLVARSESVRAATAQRIEHQVGATLDEAEAITGTLEQAMRTGALRADGTPESFEAALFVELVGHPAMADLALTHAHLKGFNPDGDAILEPQDHWQTVAYRKSGAERGKDVATQVIRTPDPTLHPTFVTTVSQEYFGKAIWSDLQYAERDQALPEAQRRVVVSVQKAIADVRGTFMGVVRVSLLADSVDRIVARALSEGGPRDPHRVFICDLKGRLISRPQANAAYQDMDDDLRVAAKGQPPSFERALASPKLAALSMEQPTASESFEADGVRYLLTLQRLRNSQDWVVAVLVPEGYYTQDLQVLLRRVLLTGALIIAAAGLCAAWVLRTIHGGFQQLLATTATMRDFNFTPDHAHAALTDVQEVSESLERAKTAMRAMGRYVPMELVKELYHHNKEPQLGGASKRVTLVFTDLQGFTALSEKLDPNVLATALGHYFEAMTDAIRATGGTVDKYIGDAIMAIWNAPSDLADHPIRACQAALHAEAATAALYRSLNWAGLPPLVTRFGLHTDTVLIGHFGAPARLSYTALGDGVNLTSRLEGLGKQYGVTRIASEQVYEAAKDAMAFRLLDRVAVKGKSQATNIYELIGPASEKKSEAVDAYEAAIKLYFARRFEEAANALAKNAATDPPSAILQERCTAYAKAPPPPNWDGGWAAEAK